MAQSSFVEADNPVEFLYLDKERVSSLIGQLSEKGVLTSLKSIVSKTVNREGKAGASLPGIDVGGKRGRTSLESAEEIYDPFWAHAFSFLRDLEENFAVPLSKGRLGSLVKFDAFLQFLDMRLMKSLWEPLMEATMRSQDKKPPSAHASRKQRRQTVQPMPNEMKLGLAVIKEMPHPLHMTFLAQGEDTVFRLWSAIRPEYLTISSDDLAMKYGATIDGAWTVVGIVDARIGEPPATLPLGSEMLDSVTTALLNVRNLIGRPKDHWGLTPIAIYAPIRGIAEAELEAGETPQPNQIK